MNKSEIHNADHFIKDLQNILPEGVDASQFKHQAHLVMKNVSGYMNCTKESMRNATLDAARFRLMPDPLSGVAYFQTYKQGADLLMKFSIGYKGLIRLARRTGEFLSFDARAYYEGDEFKCVFGTNPSLTHSFGEDYYAGKAAIKGFYGIVKFKSGEYQFEVMSIREINKIRDLSSGYKYGKGASIWDKHYEAMGKKTVLRRMSHLWPLPDEVHAQLCSEDIMQAGDKIPDRPANILKDRDILEDNKDNIIDFCDEIYEEVE